MAGELKLTINAAFTKGNVSVDTKPAQYSITVAGAHATKITASVGTSDETIAKGDIGTIGYVVVRNLDGTNYVTLGADGTNQPVRVNAGEAAAFRFSGTDLHAKANTAACVCEFTLVEA